MSGVNTNFHRFAEVKINLNDSETLKIPSPDGILNNGLHFDFMVERGLKRSLNKCQISIYNLSADFRARLEAANRDDLSQVELTAGYSGLPGETPEIGLLMRAKIAEMSTEVIGPDIEFTIRAIDGLSAKRTSRVRKLIRKGTSYADAITEILAVANVRLTGEGKDLLNGSLDSNMTFSGVAYDAAEKLARSAGYSLTIQNGSAQIDEIRPKTVPDRDDSNITVLGYSSGLANVGNRSQRGHIDGTTFLNNTIEPGRYIRIKGTKVDGLYRVRTCKHVGDTMGGAWETEFSAEET